MTKNSISENKRESQSYKTCTKCGVSKGVKEFSKRNATWDRLSSQCKACDKEWRQNHKEERATSMKIWRQNHKPDVATYNEQYNQKHKSELIAKRKKYYQAHKVERTTQSKRYHQAHKSEIAARHKLYFQTEAGKEARRKCERKRRALKLGVECEDFSIKEVFERDGYQCQLCGKKTRPDYKNHNHPLYPNLDHIVPLTLGGPHTKENTQCLCHLCNITKRNTGVGDQLRMFG